MVIAIGHMQESNSLSSCYRLSESGRGRSWGVQPAFPPAARLPVKNMLFLSCDYSSQPHRADAFAWARRNLTVAVLKL